MTVRWTPWFLWKETELALAGRNSRIFFETLRNCDALRVLFPEVDALFGVPQPAKWHPEIDTGLHVMMVLDQAEGLSDDLEVRFAALVHDLGKGNLGKGNTPVSKLPSHPGHETRGCKLIRDMSERLPVPRACRDLGVLVAEFHTHVHRALELRPETILKVLERGDAFRRPDRFEQLLLTCEADARGRSGLENRSYEQANYFRGALAAASEVDAAEIASTAEKRKIPTMIRRARTEAIDRYRSYARM
jgi:tRNA nucleotidyltransferase (CCA-adding enzyme)